MLWLMLRSIFFYWMIDSLVYLAFSNYLINPWLLGLFQIVVSLSFLSMTYVREREFARERDSIYLQVYVHTQQSRRAIMLSINVHVTDLWDMLWLFFLHSACFNAINQQEKMKRGDNAFMILTTVCSVLLLNSADSGSMIHIVQTIDSWCMLHMSSICDTCYRMLMLVQRDRDQYECSSIWYLWHDSSMLSIIVLHLHFTFMAYQCYEHTTWMWCLYSCSIFKTWESVTANVTINVLVTINSLWKQSGHLNIIIIIMHFDCIVKQFIIGYLVVVYHCIMNHFPAQNHRHHHRHHHAWCMSIVPTNVEAPTSSSSRHSRIVTASVSVAVPAVATKIEAPTIAIQQTCGDFDALHQSILQSTHILDELITRSYQQLPSI